MIAELKEEISAGNLEVNVWYNLEVWNETASFLLLRKFQVV